MKSENKKPRGGNKYPGQSPGRPKGVPNKVTTELKELYRTFLQEIVNNGELIEMLRSTAKTQPDKSLDFLIKLSKFVVPEMLSVSSDVNVKQINSVDYSKLTDDEIKKLEDIAERLRLDK